MASGLEEPEYELLSEYEGFEIRRYSESVQARLLTPSSGWSGTSGGFRRIAGYIFGGNETNQRIAMTAPVQMWDTDSGSMMSFTMPSEHSIQDLPSPIDKGVQLSLIHI